MDIESYKTQLQTIVDLGQQKKYEEALRSVEKLLEQVPFSADLLVRRGCLIQLLETSDNPAHTLESAKASFETAVALAPDSVEPLIELGNFVLAVGDNAAEALKHFQAARKLAERQHQDAMFGQARCQTELGQRDQMAETMNGLIRAYPHSDRVISMEAIVWRDSRKR